MDGVCEADNGFEVLLDMKVAIEKIKFNKEFYPRFQADNYTVNQYRQSIEQLPPILVTQGLILVDGYHRLLAHKLEGKTQIEVVFFEGKEPQEIIVEAIKRNSTHGRQLSIDEKRANAKNLYKANMKDCSEIASLLSVSERTVREWTKDLREQEREERDIEILELYLQCYSYRDISEKLEVSLDTVRRALYDNGSFSEIVQPNNLQLYNVWSVGSLSKEQLKYPGQTPQDIIENIIYYYTEPPKTNPHLQLSKVVDPMAGSGIVGEVCRKLLRRYMLFDIEPIREDIPIQKNDILKGFPEKAKNTDLVYFDPPYFNLLGDYPENEFTRNYESFLNAMEKSLQNIKAILKENGKIALILKPMNEQLLGGKWYDLTFDSFSIALDLNYQLIKRISAPLTVQQFKDFHVTQAKEKKRMLNILRDIVILEK